MATAVFHDEGRRLRTLAQDRDVKIRFSVHAAMVRMREYDISKPDVMAVLKRGTVVNVEHDGQDERWTAEGRLVSDGRLVNIVVCPRETEIEITVITVIDKTVMKHR